MFSRAQYEFVFRQLNCWNMTGSLLVQTRHFIVWPSLSQSYTPVNSESFGLGFLDLGLLFVGMLTASAEYS